MMLPILLSIAAVQTLAPGLPAGVSRDFQARILNVETQMAKGEFDAASKTLESMPNKTIRYVWDDSNVPAAQRPIFDRGRDVSLMNWRRFAGDDISFEAASQAPVVVRFADQNPPAQGSDLPMGVQVEQSDSGIVATIGLHRGKPLQPSTPNDIANDFGRVLGLYMGVGDLPLGTSVMIASDRPATSISPVPVQAANIAKSNVAIVQQLTDAVANKERIEPAEPAFFSPTKPVDLGKILQGNPQSFSISIENRGKGVLNLWIRPECGCITMEEPQSVAPGETRDIQVKFDPVEFTGKVTKKIFAVSNDPDRPLQTFEVTADITPGYQFIAPQGDVIVAGDNGATAIVYLAVNGDQPVDVRQVALNGVPGDVSYEPWSGVLADPVRGEPAKPRRGFKFTITLTGQMPPGRSPSSLMVLTTSDAFKMMQWSLFAQKGIVAVPDQAYFGVLTQAKTIKLLISRPGKGFKVLGAVSTSPHLSVSVKPGSSNQEYVLEASYDGKASYGDFQPMITVRTDDPKQPAIKIPVVGKVQ